MMPPAGFPGPFPGMPPPFAGGMPPFGAPFMPPFGMMPFGAPMNFGAMSLMDENKFYYSEVRTFKHYFFAKEGQIFKLVHF